MNFFCSFCFRGLPKAASWLGSFWVSLISKQLSCTSEQTNDKRREITNTGRSKAKRCSVVVSNMNLTQVHVGDVCFTYVDAVSKLHVVIC